MRGVKIINNLIFTLVLTVFVISGASAQNTIADIPPASEGFNRVNADRNSFAHWLRRQKLKPAGSPVLDYRGREYKKGSDSTVAFVMDMNIINRRTEQCMDILVRLYSEYLWQSTQTESAAFPLPGGSLLHWSAWKEGWRPEFKGIDLKMIKKAASDTSLSNYESYLRTIYAESHTQQFYHAYERIEPKKVLPGDFIVIKGSKSHAVMIVDVALDSLGNKMVLVGHGDTPACQFYLLNNGDSPWFPVQISEIFLPLPIKRKMSWAELRRFYPLH